ncbi:translocation/assembly module TamB domain-containing protein [Nubsella zeaxanthinifaciens]|uniref:translocation/assembly module TamB domain-containing protein n=1 Tax=Nubsella zeaxanthinifaciens TaxID=392412 RepID=UPI001EEED43B|nr:translocation/assembly module TamB domain-containing protein [Nubsella zeaxanthinifaciens]
MIAGVLFSLQFKPVQTYVAQKAAAYLSKELKTTVRVGGLYVVPFKSVVLEDLLVLDLEKDTLAHFPKFLVDINQFSLKQRILDVNTVQINNGTFFLKDQKDGNSNLDFIIDYFDSPSPKPKKKKKKFEFLFDRIIINNLHFKYKNLKYNRPSPNAVNFEDIDVKEMNGIFEGLNTKDHFIQANIKNLTLKEKSGFYLKNLTALATVDSNAIELKKLLLITNRTRLTDYYQMKFKTFRDFKDYENKVRMKANFKNSHLSSSDVAFFAPALQKMKLDIDIDGQINGLVNDLRAKKLSIKAGRATYIKGDFSMKGLPNWEETFMDMKIELAGTNKKDLDEILTDLTGKKVKSIPEIVNKFGNINFNGYFTGFQNDFIAYGEFKTKLGRLRSDVNMKIDKKGTPSYSGNVKTYDFNIGDLLNEKLLGRITSELNIKGKGTEVKELTEELKGQISYLDFKGYRYRNININGTFDKKFFDGSLKINDKNVQLDFDGGVNLNPKLPVFNFRANIRNARLKTLKLYKDSLKVDAIFSTNFSGTNLDNLQGSLLLQQITINNLRGVYKVDSVLLNARGIGMDRSLTVNSDILEAGIKGQYDLSTIVSYFKTIGKTYIPSLKTDIVKFKTQVFDFRLKIKDFEPIAELISPGLEIDDQSLLVGSFDSRNNTATLGGIVKRLKYKGVIANNIIIDESTSPKQLTAIISSDRVDLNDSLYIKNVNISNILRNDSLSLNVKLSNADDANQLDLNGLVEFLPDTAKISILPSNLKINFEDWTIEDKVQIGFNKGKTKIDNFSLSNGQQELKIDGVISDDPADVILVALENFKLKTINPFVKNLGIKFAGTANGKTKINGVLKSPKISDSLRIDSLGFNGTYIGSLVDTSSFNSTSKLANVHTKITALDRETFNITGNLDVGQKEIDLKVNLDQSELAILTPFLNKIVSNLKGKVSADLTVKGKFDQPLINGDITLDQAQLTVNYLKTTYVIDDEVKVDNSAIVLTNLVLKDLEGHSGTANGTVDLKDINNPNIQVQLDAKGLMALNTTSKDNAIYFGKAYGTGKFIFKGPTNDMFIDIDAKTEKGTIFNLPLNSSETVTDKDFITFVSKDTTKVVKKINSFQGLSMNFKLSVDPNTTVNIYTVLGKLSGTGNADLELNISKVGDFEMKGDYIIESGVFDFTAREVINKRFDIRQGGTIRWTGNPVNAQINLKAIYTLRAALGDLYRAANRDASSNANQTAQTEVEMGLTGLLMKPDIKLDIFFPANPAIKDELQSYFNDGNNLNTQALSLIIQRRFAPGTGSENLSQQLGSVGTGTATDLIFNQLNNVLSSLNLNFVDINIRSFNEASASFKFFNDRIIVNAGITDISKSSIDNTIGFRNEIGREVEILGLIKKDGSLVGKIANKPPTIQSIFANPGINPYQNITSLGLIYNQQFDTFTELLQKISGKYRKEQKKKEAEREKQRVTKEAIINESKKTQRR